MAQELAENSNQRNIIVIGASAGGFNAIKKLVTDLPKELDAAVFIVWHMADRVTGVLPDVLNKLNRIPSSNAVDFEQIQFNHIYVAPVDRHMVLEGKLIRTTRGPKENRFRPAVDPLFRSAAMFYGSRVIGVILSGALDDGTSGLWAVKENGGIAIVQDPEDAEVRSMPESAMRAVDIDFKVPISQLAALLVELCSQKIPLKSDTAMDHQNRTRIEVDISLQNNRLEENGLPFGEFTPFTCPDCYGVLSAIKDGKRTRYRCHTGHAFSPDSLLAAITEGIEEGLWSALRNIRESVMLLNFIGDHYAENNQPRVAAMYFQKAKDANQRAEAIRLVTLEQELLNADEIRLQAERETR